MPQKTLIFALFAPPEMLRGGTLPFCPPLCTPLKYRRKNLKVNTVGDKNLSVGKYDIKIYVGTKDKFPPPRQM